MSILARVRGTIDQKTSESVVVWVGGFGLEVQAPLSTLSAIGEAGEDVSLHTHLHLREGALGLYGFATEEEQRMFELLLTVTGVGPRAALNCLSFLTVERLAVAIAGGDGEALRRVPGVGRKTADRILLELKNRVQGSAGTPSPAPQQVPDEAVEALMFYGYSAAEAAAAVAALPKDRELSVEERTMLALRYFAPQAERRASRAERE